MTKELENKKGMTNKGVYQLIKEIINDYMVMSQDDVEIVTIWAMADAHISDFYTFPFLRLDATKGSGKTRLLKLLNAIIPDTQIVNSFSEAALFRTIGQEHVNGLLLDESKRYTREGQENIRELLQVCYKRGARVSRVGTDRQGTRVMEHFDVYTGIALASIGGLDEVLEDRAIVIVLERSDDENTTRLPEAFELEERISKVRSSLETVYEPVEPLEPDEPFPSYINIIKAIRDELLKRKRTLDMHVQGSEPSEPSSGSLAHKIAEKILQTKLVSRDFECWTPLFMQAYEIGEDVFNRVLSIANSKVGSKHQDEVNFDMDTQIAVFLNEMMKEPSEVRYYPEIIEEYVKAGNTVPPWLNSSWLGHYFRRANLGDKLKKTSRGFPIRLSRERIQKFLQRRGLDNDDVIQKILDA